MNATLTAAVLTLIAVCSAAGGEANFVTYPLSHGCSLELPRSWKVTTNFNQDFNELGQAAYDVAKDKISGIPSGTIKSELFAVKRFERATASIFVSFIESPAATQLQLSQMSDDQRIVTANAIRTALVNSKLAPQNVSVVIEKRGQLFVIISTGSDKSNKLDKDYIVQVPLGTRILQIQFRCESGEWDLWQVIFNKIILSIKVKA